MARDPGAAKPRANKELAMDLGGFLWTLIKIGPLFLLAAIAWAIWRNKRSRVPDAVTDAGTRRVYHKDETRPETRHDDSRP
jgi:hypothetical protein